MWILSLAVWLLLLIGTPALILYALLDWVQGGAFSEPLLRTGLLVLLVLYFLRIRFTLQRRTRVMVLAEALAVTSQDRTWHSESLTTYWLKSAISLAVALLAYVLSWLPGDAALRLLILVYSFVVFYISLAFFVLLHGVVREVEELLLR